MSKKPYVVVKVRISVNNKTPIQENATGTSIWYDYTVLTQEAIEKNQFSVPWYDGHDGYHYALLNIYDIEGDDDDE